MERDQTPISREMDLGGIDVEVEQLHFFFGVMEWFRVRGDVDAVLLVWPHHRHCLVLHHLHNRYHLSLSLSLFFGKGVQKKNALLKGSLEPLSKGFEEGGEGEWRIYTLLWQGKWAKGDPEQQMDERAETQEMREHEMFGRV